MRGLDGWTGERAKDRRRAAVRNARIRAHAERWGPTIEAELTKAMGRYLQLRFPEPLERPTFRIVVHAETPDEHAGSPRSVSWFAAARNGSTARASNLPELAVELTSWLGRFGEHVRFRCGGAEHPVDGDLGRWLEARLAARIASELGQHR